MKRVIYILLLLLLPLVTLSAQGDKQQKKTYIVGFYNLENLFDVYDDPVKNDDEFLPDGGNKWTEDKYWKKQHNMATVIAAMAQNNNGHWHTLLGISEIENRLVIEDLVSQPEISAANFQIVHYDSPDRRGVDVALLYQPNNFTYIDSESIPFDFNSSTIKFSMDKEEQERFRTRDILMVHGLIDGEDVAVYVAHLPSRVGGKGEDLRSRGAEIIYNHAMETMKKYPGIKIIVMGDMNDNPTDVSMTDFLHGKEKPEEVTPTDFFSPFLSMMKAGYGSLAYQGTWNIFDNIFVNETLLNAEPGTLKIRQTSKKGFYGVVFKEPWMLQQSGQYKGTPFRTYSNGAFVNGYSDHLPTFILLEK